VSLPFPLGTLDQDTDTLGESALTGGSEVPFARTERPRRRWLWLLKPVNILLNMQEVGCGRAGLQGGPSDIMPGLMSMLSVL
jgi:hypothetical protein